MTCVAIRAETPSISTFSFRPEDGSLDHVPGQALVLGVPVGERLLWRSFTISGARDDLLDLTIKAQGTGGATRWLHDHLRPGMQIRARGPSGDFTLAQRRNERVAMISAGSGATPMMAMLERLSENQPDADLVWFHAAHAPDEVLFAERLTRLQATMPHLGVFVTVSQTGPGWFGYRGRITRRLLSTAIPDLGRREVYCCGPEGFMRETRLIHHAEGGDPAEFHTESFGAASAAPPAAEAMAEAMSGKGHQLTIGDRVLRISAAETILQASLRQGLIIPCGCGRGMCGTCMVRLVSGDISARTNGGLADEDAAAGYVLACSTRVTSDAEIALIKETET